MEASKSKLNEFQSIIVKGKSLGLNMTDISEKFENAILNSKDDIIRIVLLGAFSDGKTSAIAGLLGQVIDNMKIDIDESSDELEIYRPKGLKQGYEIVDTPGLFGTNSKEIDGKEIKYSDITKKYISEAHIVIYVTDAVNPLKGSHRNILKLVLRDFNKLRASIFVINKMDEAGVDMSDEKDYEEAAKIKRKTFIERLDNTISLTDKEKKNLRIACIASNPNNRGLEKWFQDQDAYTKRSHISQLRDYVSEITNTLDKEDLKIQVDLSVLQDLIMQLAKQIAIIYKELEDPLVNIKSEVGELEHQLGILRSDLEQNCETMTNRLQTLKDSLLMDVKNASTLEEFSNILDTKIGIQDDKVTFYVFERMINQILSSCTESNNASTNTKKASFESSFSHADDFLKTEALKAAKYVGKIKVNGEMVKTARDIFAQGHKFKPWGAIKMGKNITKGLALLGVLAEATEWGMQWYNKRKLDKGKKELRDTLNDTFANIYSLFNQDEEYYKNFAPTFIDLRNQIEERKKMLSQLEERNQNIRLFKSDVEKWYGQDIEDVEYEEV